MQKTVKRIAGIALILLAFESQAQQVDTTRVYQLNPVTITATKTPRKIADVGRSVTVITSDDLKNSIYNDVGDLLSRQEGIYVVGAAQNPGSLQSVFIRGSNSNQTAIIIDGVRITDPSSVDNAIDLSELSLSDIDRIEIVRGSHSTLYGSSAIGGTINIVTKKSSAIGFNANAQVKTGTFGKNTSSYTENIGLNYTYKSGLYINGEVFNTNVKGINATSDTITNPNVFKHPNLRDNFTKTDLMGKVGFRNNKLDIYTAYKSVNQKTDIDDGAFKDDDNYQLDFKRDLITYGLAYQINDKIKLSYIGGRTDLTRVSTDDSSAVNKKGTTDRTFFEGIYNGKVVNNELQGNLRLKGLDAVIGGGVYQESMTLKTYYTNAAFNYVSKTNLDTLDPKAVTHNAFMHVDLNGILLSEKLKTFSVGLGTRYTNHSLFGRNLTYEINPSLKISGNTLLYGAYTTGFNAPPLYRLYSPEKNTTSGVTRGNKTLKAETSQSYEIGIKQKVNENVFFSMAYFNTVTDNLIEYVYLWNKNKDIKSLGFADYRGDTYTNIGKQFNRGVEFGITTKISNELSFSGNFALLNGKLEYNPANVDTSHTNGNYIQTFTNGIFLTKKAESLSLVRRPSSFNISFTYNPITKLSFKVDTRYVGARNDIYYNNSLGPFGALATTGMEDYTLIDLSLKYDILKTLAATIKFENMLDTKYNEIKGYSARGKGVFFNFRYQFTSTKI